MDTQDLRRSSATATLLTEVDPLARLLGIMSRWWEGRSLTRIAREFGISRQRTGVLLASVGCTRSLWCRADHDRPGSRRRAMLLHVAQAREALLHPLAPRLTARQRAALAWQAQGLVRVDIARRMDTSPQNVRSLQVAGQWRLDRLSRGKAESAGADAAPPEDMGGVSIDWRELEAGIGAYG